MLQKKLLSIINYEVETTTTTTKQLNLNIIDFKLEI